MAPDTAAAVINMPSLALSKNLCVIMCFIKFHILFCNMYLLCLAAIRFHCSVLMPWMFSCNSSFCENLWLLSAILTTREEILFQVFARILETAWIERSKKTKFNKNDDKIHHHWASNLLSSWFALPTRTHTQTHTLPVLMFFRVEHQIQFDAEYWIERCHDSHFYL